METTEFRIELVRRVDESYPVIVGRGIESAVLDVASRPGLTERRAVLITDSTVGALVAAPLVRTFERGGRKLDVLTFPEGEQHKTRATKERIEDELIARDFGRDTLIIAAGGGVVTDLAGFVAATFTRGVPYISVSTTLLGAADAAVGGKTAVDTPAATNLIGAFHQPSAVVIDLDRWKTLSTAQIQDGMGETVKHACLADVSFFEELERAFVERHMSPEEFVRDDALAELTVRRNCEIKRDFVMSDVFEGNRRMGLNLGHTIGRALEAAMGYTMSHGACVAVGLNMQAQWGVQFGYVTREEQQRLEALLLAIGLPIALPAEVSVDAIMNAMVHDKKAKGGAIRFVFQRGIGDLMVFDGGSYARPIPVQDIRAFLTQSLA
ncbi:MAG: 3-dehydroquinate synthase [Ancrocorticia sp.]|jgi:3-dehydroquinate synthase|nr:3-dehydroquinate synthase [Ancrocorticia sp.]MCI1895937.1 3-dehydroquinate synthase [Ancrocorticia sp.]MCI1932798.1 3-dehydroquinate synthase [Ancrocorticia sp.]MCI1964340.1 3-dehydroquinate synthase [Ancrocorticia sp.]MCI2002932.1 3-dehydroquinate synthase [Ancrocorticia sp.]